MRGSSTSRKPSPSKFKPNTLARIARPGATVIQGTPEQYLAYVKAESAKWGPVVKRANIVAE